VPAPPTDWLKCEMTACWLTERGANWILGLLGTIELERGLRGLEHQCLDEHEDKGVIRQ
jgi:hypothetical protein